MYFYGRRAAEAILRDVLLWSCVGRRNYSNVLLCPSISIVAVKNLNFEAGQKEQQGLAPRIADLVEGGCQNFRDCGEFEGATPSHRLYPCPHNST